jgi:hypothetical protein
MDPAITFLQLEELAQAFPWLARLLVMAWVTVVVVGVLVGMLFVASIACLFAMLFYGITRELRRNVLM